MRVIETGIPGLLVVEPVVHGDNRGFFMETWRAGAYRELGMPDRFVQANQSRSREGVIRGLHFQYPQPQGKLVWVLEGRAFDVAVDIRPDSPTYRQWASVELSAENRRQFWIPEGFAHGFCALGGSVTLSYLCTAEYAAEFDASIAWNDPDIGIEWPIAAGELSGKDAAAPCLADFDPARLPRMAA
ncbi:MAG: dTDP-4-dehydrorhamnose 3,5-epimerase [Xanthomonadales bacterium]|nr:dTDP-4-dehydrorhamnose 3,5-epimerase [Xanthomonadales bacterium]